MSAQARQALLLLASAMVSGDADDIVELWWYARAMVAKCAEHTPQGSMLDQILTRLRQGPELTPEILRGWATAC